MTTSSGGGSNESDPPLAKILDLRDRLPPVLKGNDPSCNMGVAILKTIIQHDQGNPHEWFAGLMLASHALQRMLRDKDQVDTQQMQSILAQAMEIADTTRIHIGFKGEPPKEGG